MHDVHVGASENMVAFNCGHGMFIRDLTISAEKSWKTASKVGKELFE